MRENLKKYLGYIVAVIALLLMTYTCVNNSILRKEGENNIYEKQLERRVKTLQANAADYKKYSDSLSKDSKVKDATIASLKKKNEVVTGKLADNESKKKADLQKVKSFTYKQSAEYIGKTYDSPKSVSYTDIGVVLNDSVPNKVVATIVEKAALETKVGLIETKLSNTVAENKQLGGKVENTQKALSAALDVSSKKDEALQLSQEYNKNVQKENRKLKTSSFIGRVLIVAAFIGGVLIGGN
jgi:hypothetical protein